VDLADVVCRTAQDRGLVVDSSTRAEDTLLGNDWYAFLGKCRYTVGVEGGASILDADGRLKDTTRAYVAEHPDADFDEIEAACFPGRDGEFNFRALSPRHLEACATRTGQIVVEGEYDGVLRADVHYLELKRDFSNLGEILEKVQLDEGREEMVNRAYEDIVSSGWYSYRAFVRTVLTAALPLPLAPRSSRVSVRRRTRTGIYIALDRLSWVVIRGRPFLIRHVLKPLRGIRAAFRPGQGVIA
jgi:hypothetical protein